jgi:hypothetical protein
MAIALAEAAVSCGLEITLLPAADHRGGPGRAPDPGQARFCDPSAQQFLERVDGFRSGRLGGPAFTSVLPRTACAPCRRVA